MLLKLKNYYLLLILVSGLVQSCVKQKEPEIPLVPTSNFAFSFGKNGEVKFTDKSENAISYQWEFGDGSTSTEQNPTHTYADEKAYSVMLTVESKAKQKKALQQTITIENYEPIADFKYDMLEGGKVKFTNLSKYASTYIWDIEGRKEQIDKLDFDYQFKKNGNHTITLNVEKKNGLKAIVSKELAIKNLLTSADSTAGVYIGDFMVRVDKDTKTYKNFEINFEKLSDSTIVIKKITTPEFSAENIVYWVRDSKVTRLGPDFCEGYIRKEDGLISFCVIYYPIWVGFSGYKVK